MHFLSYVLQIVCKMNQDFQSDRSVIHTLHGRMVSFYKLLLSNYMKKTYIESVPINLLNPKHISNYKQDPNDVYAGPEAELFLSSEVIDKPIVHIFRRNILGYYVELCNQIRSRYDFKDSGVLKNLCLINPEHIFEFSDSDKSISPLLTHFRSVYKIPTL